MLLRKIMKKIGNWKVNMKQEKSPQGIVDKEQKLNIQETKNKSLLSWWY